MKSIIQTITESKEATELAIYEALSDAQKIQSPLIAMFGQARLSLSSNEYVDYSTGIKSKYDTISCKNDEFKGFDKKVVSVLKDCNFSQGPWIMVQLTEKWYYSPGKPEIPSVVYAYLKDGSQQSIYGTSSDQVKIDDKFNGKKFLDNYIKNLKIKEIDLQTLDALTYF